VTVGASSPVTARGGLAGRRTNVLAGVRPLLLAAAGVWGVAFSVLAGKRHNAFLSHRFDLGNMTQAVWATAHGHPLEVTSSTGEQVSRLGSHVDPLLALFAPFWWVWPSPLMLTTLQSLALASGALPVFWLARKHAGDERAAWSLAAAYLLYPAVQWSALNDFHPVTFAIPLLLYLVWFLDEDRLFAAAVVAVLAASSKENIPLVIAGIGLWYGIRRGRPIVGAVIAMLGIAWTAVALAVVVPHFSAAPSSFYDRYASVGGSPGGVLETVFHDPLRLWDAATTGGDLRYLALLLVPLAGLWALEPILALAAVPILALNLLADFWSMNRIEYQYVSGIVPCLFAAAAIGLGTIQGRRSVVAAVTVLVLVGLANISGPLAAVRTYGEGVRATGVRVDPAGGAKLDAIRAAIDLVPSGAPVTATNRIGAHLSDRRQIFLFPAQARGGWIVIDTDDPWLARPREAVDPGGFARELGRLLEDPAWRLVFRRQGVLVFRSFSSAAAAGAVATR
jgi:uncharacterized membrane protein